MVNIPLDSVNAVNLYAGADYYTSASTDNIDNNMSSASSKDLRGFGTLSYSRLNLRRGETYGMKIGFSAEYDVTSINAGISYTKAWNESNTLLTVAGQVFLDRWSLIYPIELRGRVNLPTQNRRSYNGSFMFSQILSKKAQVSLSAEVIYMEGLLSTPFHRVYFADNINKVDIERLPDRRLKVPLSIRLNYFPVDNIVLRTYYRYYWDDFGIRGNTFELEIPIKVGKLITVSPFYRYHTQSAADYFAPFEAHLSAAEFYTSDFDLSTLQSNKWGMGIRYYPVYGILRSKPLLKGKRIFMVKYLELRGAYYERNTGLNAIIGSLNLGIGIK